MKALQTLLERGKIVVDSAGEIFAEYKNYCNAQGQPGIGDLFFREILQNYSGKVLRVELAKNPDGSFADFPSSPALIDFDMSDRKFVAAAVKSGARVVNSTDTDWLEHKGALNDCGIVIEFVCSEDQHTW
jgi:hypothetical protein